MFYQLKIFLEPFDAILGHSQGACLILLLDHLMSDEGIRSMLMCSCHLSALIVVDYLENVVMIQNNISVPQFRIFLSGFPPR
jgi:hypothetical protein